MSHFNKILVVADPTVEEQKALSRAFELAEKHPCKITLFLSIYDFSYEMTTMLSADERSSMKDAVINDRQKWLYELARTNGADMDNITVKVDWHNRPYESIIKEAISGQYDLVVKGTHKHDVLKSVVFTPTDWHLLRKCPTAVLLVKDHAWPEHGKVLAAVNTGDMDDDHGNLNSGIIEHASFMSRLLNSETHLINAFPPTPINIAVEIPDFDAIEYSSNLKAHHDKSLQELASKFDINVNNLHLKEGMPEDVIPELAENMDAELVVMGTIGRTGISAALIGNTAEHVIDNINCDLLAIKPSDFETPIAV
ncbi:MAG: universal stress protein UspE [Gammaproteobacteria bacterium]|nr:universal stress protein UspE [Gammaproteobacteria bacterium]